MGHVWDFFRKLIKRFVKPNMLYKDCTARDQDAVPGVSGFPCQPFSLAGLRRGTQDPRGQLVMTCLEYITRKTPRAFVLENVTNLLNFPEVFNFLVEYLRNIVDDEGKTLYEVHWQISHTTSHGGLPQHRERVFIVGLQCQRVCLPFFWPTPASKVKLLSEILSDDMGAITIIDSMNLTKRTNLALVLESTRNIDGDVIAELGSSYKKFMVDVCPCLTASRTGDQAYFSVKRMRPATMEELMKLQGMQPEWLPGWETVVSHRQMGKLVGNAMTVTLMERIMRKVFLSLGWAVTPDKLD